MSAINLIVVTIITDRCTIVCCR